MAMELVFLVNIARRATRERIIPKAIDMTQIPPALEVYTTFFGTEVEKSTAFFRAFHAWTGLTPELARESMVGSNQVAA